MRRVLDLGCGAGRHLVYLAQQGFEMYGTDVDPHGLDVTVRLNGRVEHRFNTQSMIHDVATIVSYISEYSTLYPGDLIFTGTSGTTRALKPGDLVEVEISGIGILQNPVVMEK